AAKYGDFYALVEKLTELGIYSTHIMEKYTKEEIECISGKIQPDRDWLFDYLGLYTLATRYLATDHDKNIYELPQERWMIIAMYLMQDEDKVNRRAMVEDEYWEYITVYSLLAMLALQVTV